MANISWWVVSGLLGLLLFGCSTGLRPTAPPVLAPDTAVTEYPLTEFHINYAAYTNAFVAGRLDEAQRLRDLMINRTRTDIESSYRAFESALFLNRAVGDTGADMAELGVSAAIAVVGGESVKALLAAALTAFKGTRLSIDKNFFREKTTEFVISKMQAQRDRKQTELLGKMVTLDVRKYTFEEAWVDLIDLFYAGTLPAAIQALAADAGKQAVEAQEARRIQVQERIQIVKAGPELVNRRRALTKELSGMSPERARRILKALNVSDIGQQNPMERLRMEIEATGPDEAKMKQLEEAFKTQ